MGRTNKIVLVVGRRNSGKTNYIKENIILASRQPKTIIFDTFDSPAWRDLKTVKYPFSNNIKVPVIPEGRLGDLRKGVYRYLSSNPKDFFQDTIDCDVRHALAIYEDSTRYVQPNPYGEMMDLVWDSKQRDLDMVFVFHSLASVPPALVRAVDLIVLFETQEEAPSPSKYPFPEIKEAMIKLKSMPKYSSIPIFIAA